MTFHVTETVWLENVLGFVRVIDRVLECIAEKLPEILILNEFGLRGTYFGTTITSKVCEH